MSAQDIEQARRWATRASNTVSSTDHRHACAAIATAWAYIAWVDQQQRNDYAQ